MKKIISIMLCIASVFCIAACGDASTADTTTETTVTTSTTSTTAATTATTAATTPPPAAQPDNTQYGKIEVKTHDAEVKTPIDKTEYENLITDILKPVNGFPVIYLVLEVDMAAGTELSESDIEALNARDALTRDAGYLITIEPQNVNTDAYRNLTINENVVKILFTIQVLQFVPT